MLVASCLSLLLTALPHDEEPQAGLYYYDRADVRIEAQRIGGRELYDPDIAVVDGTVWLAWLKHQPGQGDELWLGSQVHGKWENRERVSGVGPAICRPTLTANDAGQLWLSFETQGPGEAWHVEAARVVEGRIRGLAMVTAKGANSINHRADAAGAGAPHFVWQEDQGGQYDVLGRQWGEEPGPIERISASPGNDWRPDVCVDGAGRATVVWDGYVGSYDVFARRRDMAGAWGDVLALAEGPSFQANASVECAADGRTWIVWEEGAENWGHPYVSVSKLFNNVTDDSGPLHRFRRLQLTTLSATGEVGEVVGLPMPSLEHAAALLDRRPGVRDLGVFYERAELAVDEVGRPWLAYRHFFETQLGKPEPTEHHIQKGWKLYARRLERDGWSRLFTFDVGQHDGMQRVSLASTGSGLLAVWDTGRTDRRGERKNRGTFLAVLDAGSGEAPTFRKSEEPLVPAGPFTPVTKVRPARDGLQLFYGDLHRHTDLSLCMPFFDGSLEDTYRYASDVARLDFLSITDHARDMDDGDTRSQIWWRSTKEVSRHRLRGTLFPYYGYERSHRDTDHNVISLRTDILQNPTPVLTEFWDSLDQDSFTVPHTPYKGDVWEYHNPRKRPLAEVFSGMRNFISTNHVHEGLGKGYRFGFIASSDHLSTSAAYACVWAPEATREAVFKALKKRRTFAATSRMELAFRCGEAWMGEAIKHKGTPVFQLSVLGTAPIERADFYVNGALVETVTPDEAELELVTEMRGPDDIEGEHYYYVHVVQVDGNQAWSSPIWVRRKN